MILSRLNCIKLQFCLDSVWLPGALKENSVNFQNNFEKAGKFVEDFLPIFKKMQNIKNFNEK